jgi:hypothetical protein
VKQYTNINETRATEPVRGRLASNAKPTMTGSASRGERGKLASNVNETVVRLGEHAGDGGQSQ